MARNTGIFVEITEEMMSEFVDEFIFCTDLTDMERRKDVRSAFVKWLHLEHGRYERDITNSKAAELYDVVFGMGSIDEAIDANGDSVFLGIVLFDPEESPTEVRPAPRTDGAISGVSMLLQQPSQWTAENLAEYNNQIFQKIVTLGQENPPLAEVLLDLWGRSTIESHLNTQGIYLSLNEFREDLRSCLDEMVGDHVEDHVGYQAEELKRRFDRVLARHAKQIERINEWRSRFDDMK